MGFQVNYESQEMILKTKASRTTVDWVVLLDFETQNIIVILNATELGRLLLNPPLTSTSNPH